MTIETNLLPEKISTPEDLTKLLAVARRTLEGFNEQSAQVNDQGAKLNAVDKLATELRSGIEQLQAAEAERRQYVPTGTDAEVTRSYFRANEGQGDQRLRKVCDLRQAGQKAGVPMTDAATETAPNVRWAGSDAGVVRLYGGWERGQWVEGLLTDPRPKSAWQMELQQRVEHAAWVAAMKPGLAKEMRAGIVEFLREGPAPIAKVFSANTGEGGDWIFTMPLMMLERNADIPRVVESQLQDLQISAKSMDLPILTTRPQPYQHGVPISGDLTPTLLPRSVPGTTKRTLTAPTLAINIPIENDAIEDVMVFDSVALMQQIAGESMVAAREDAYINGDGAASHQDTGLANWNPNSYWLPAGLGSSVDHRKSMTGFRARAVDVSATGDLSASDTVAGKIAARANLTAPHGALDLFYLVSVENYLAKWITDTNVLTVDKFGPAATVHTGQVAVAGGSPVLLSTFMTSDLNASGIYDDTTKTYTSNLIVAGSRFRNVRRRGLRVAISLREEYGLTFLTLTERAGLGTIDGSTDKNVYMAYKLAKS